MSHTQNQLLLHSDPAEVVALQTLLLAWCGEAGVDELAAFQLTCAVVEAVNNCIEHAYQGEPGHPIALGWLRGAEGVEVEIRDRGRPMADPPAASAPVPETDADSGRGWPIIQAWTDRVRYRREGEENVLTLTRHLP